MQPINIRPWLRRDQPIDTVGKLAETYMYASGLIIPERAVKMVKEEMNYAQFLCVIMQALEAPRWHIPAEHTRWSRARVPFRTNFPYIRFYYSY